MCTIPRQVDGIAAQSEIHIGTELLLFHDTFLFILVNFPSYHKITSLGAWLRRITINKAIDYYRKTERQRTASLEDLTLEPGADAAPLNELLTMPQLVGLINELPDKYRTAFNLYVIDGYEQEEIVSIMDESSTNVRTLIFRARNILQKKIQQYLNHEEFSI